MAHFSEHILISSSHISVFSSRFPIPLRFETNNFYCRISNCTCPKRCPHHPKVLKTSIFLFREIQTGSFPFLIFSPQFLFFFFPLGPNIFSIFNHKLAVNFFPRTKTSTLSICGGGGGAIEGSTGVTEMKYWNGC